MSIEGYPNEFLGRCAFCLDNALMSTDCGKINRWGAELSSRECLAMKAREDFDRKHSSPPNRGKQEKGDET